LRPRFAGRAATRGEASHGDSGDLSGPQRNSYRQLGRPDMEPLQAASDGGCADRGV